MCTDATALAIIQIRYKEAFCLLDTALGTVNLTQAAFDAFFVVDYGHKRPPSPGFSNPGAARIYQLACLNFH
jgi:hypothetical protein